MIDIILLALPEDRARAEIVLDALHEGNVAGANRTRFLTEHPLDLGWTTVVRGIESCPCVIFCWSRNTTAADAAPFRALGVHALAERRAISVLLDASVLPVEMMRSTTYPLYGWRSAPRGWARFVFGRSYLDQIAVAAARKVTGQDPPPPSALWVMIRSRAWAVLLGIVAVLSAVSMLWGLYNDTNISKLHDAVGARALATAKGRRSCSALRAFIADRPDSPWATDAQTALAGCHLVQRSRPFREEKSFPAFGETWSEAQADAQRICRGYAEAVVGRLENFTISDFRAGASAMANCTVRTTKLETVEVFGDQLSQLSKGSLRL